MKKLFSKTVAVVLSAACVGSLMTASFEGKLLFVQERIVHAANADIENFESFDGFVSAGAIGVYDKPSFSVKALKYLNKNDKVTIYESKNGYGKINKSKDEWVYLSCIGYKATIKSRSVEACDGNGGYVRKLSKGTEVKIYQVFNGKARITESKYNVFHEFGTMMPYTYYGEWIPIDSVKKITNSSTKEVSPRDLDINTCIEKYGTHEALIGYNPPVSINGSKCYIFEVRPDQTQYIDITISNNITFEIYKRTKTDNYQRIDSVDSNEYNDVFLFEKNYTYYIKTYLAGSTEVSGNTLCVYDTLHLQPHVDKTVNSSRGIWIPNDMMYKEGNLISTKSIIGIEYVPKDKVKDLYDDIEDMEIYKYICAGAEKVCAAGEIIVFGIIEAISIEYLGKYGTALGAVVPFMIGDTTKVNAWKYITEGIERSSNMNFNKEPQNGIIIVYEYSNDPRPAEPIIYPYFYEWDGETMEGEKGNIGSFTFLD